MDISFKEFLAWAQDPGISVVAGVFTSIIAEYIPRFDKLEKKWKMPIVLAFNVGIPLTAAGAGVAMGYQALDFDATFWPALVAGVLAFAGGQGKWLWSEVIKFKALNSPYKPF